MKIIEAMKRIKLNREKLSDLHKKINSNAAHMNFETPLYGDRQRQQVAEWLQSTFDINQEIVRLSVAISRTNLATQVTIEIGGKLLTKSITEWVLRRREGAALDLAAWQQLTDRGLKEATAGSSTSIPVELKIVRYFDPVERDRKLTEFREEPHLIDSALEIVNATTDLIE